MTNGRKALAHNLRTLRESMGLSQKTLAARSGVSFRSIQNAEQLLSDLGADSLVALADALNVTVDGLVRTEIPPRPSKGVEIVRALELLGKALENSAFRESIADEIEATLTRGK